MMRIAHSCGIYNGRPMDVQWTSIGRPNGRPNGRREKTWICHVTKMIYIYIYIFIIDNYIFISQAHENIVNYRRPLGRPLGRPLDVHWTSIGRPL